MSDVFLSYAREDKEMIRQLVSALEHEGFVVWWDHAIEAGDEWDKSIEQAIRKAQCVVVFWTKQAADSRWVRAEAREALSRGKLVPVMLEVDAIPLGFSGVQALPMVGWDGSSGTEEYARLVTAIHKKLQSLSPSSDQVSESNIPITSHTVPAIRQRSKTAYFWLCVPTVLTVLAVVGSTFWPITPRVFLKLMTDQLEFQVANDSAAVPFTTDLQFHNVTLEQLDTVSLVPKSLEVADPSSFNLEEGRYPEDAWHDLVVDAASLRLVGRQPPFKPAFTLERFTKSARSVGTIDGMTLPKESTVILETSQEGNLTMTIRTVHGPLGLVISNVRDARMTVDEMSLEGVTNHPYTREPSLTYRAKFASHRTRIEVESLRQQLVVITGLLKASSQSIMAGVVIPLKAIDFSALDPSGNRIAPQGLNGTIWYVDYPTIPSRTFASPDYLTIDKVQDFEMKQIAFEPSKGVFEVQLEGKAKILKTGTAKNRREHQLTLFEVARHSPLFVALFGLIAWVLPTSVGIFQLRRGRG